MFSRFSVSEVMVFATQPDRAPLEPTLPFTARALLAPMEGVTDPAFRDVVLDRNRADQLGGAFTEFIRVTQHPASVAQVERHMGERRFDIPVGVQLMGGDPGLVALSAVNAVVAGAPVVDLNFGCPAKGALRGCAGSSLLDDPGAVEGLIRASVVAIDGRAPLTAKIRAGIDDDALVEDLARAAEAGGAAMLTIHCRTRAEGYQDEVDWTRIARAVAAVGIPVCGNGGVACHGDIGRMRSETGCAFVMVGRAALGDPWIFSGRRVDRAEAIDFLREYAANLRGDRAGTPIGVNARLKQLINFWTAGDLIAPGTRTDWLRSDNPTELIALPSDQW